MNNKTLPLLALGVAIIGAILFYFNTPDKEQEVAGVKIGVILGFTGPIESLTPAMAAGAELAIAEINEAGNFSMGKVSAVRADSTCIDSSAATAAAERLITDRKSVG